MPQNNNKIFGSLHFCSGDAVIVFYAVVHSWFKNNDLSTSSNFRYLKNSTYWTLYMLKGKKGWHFVYRYYIIKSNTINKFNSRDDTWVDFSLKLCKVDKLLFNKPPEPFIWIVLKFFWIVRKDNQFGTSKQFKKWTFKVKYISVLNRTMYRITWYMNCTNMVCSI